MEGLKITPDEVKKLYCTCGRTANPRAGSNVHCVYCGSAFHYGKVSCNVYAVLTELADMLGTKNIEELPGTKFSLVSEVAYNHAVKIYREAGMTKQEIENHATIFAGYHCRKCNHDFSTADTCQAPSVGSKRTSPVVATSIITGKPLPTPAEIAEILYPMKDKDGNRIPGRLSTEGGWFHWLKLLERKRKSNSLSLDDRILFDSRQFTALAQKYLYPEYEGYLAAQEAAKATARTFDEADAARATQAAKIEEEFLNDHPALRRKLEAEKQSTEYKETFPGFTENTEDDTNYDK